MSFSVWIYYYFFPWSEGNQLLFFFIFNNSIIIINIKYLYLTTINNYKKLYINFKYQITISN